MDEILNKLNQLEDAIIQFEFLEDNQSCEIALASHEGELYSSLSCKEQAGYECLATFLMSLSSVTPMEHIDTLELSSQGVVKGYVRFTQKNCVIQKPENLFGFVLTWVLEVVQNQVKSVQILSSISRGNYHLNILGQAGEIQKELHFEGGNSFESSLVFAVREFACVVPLTGLRDPKNYTIGNISLAKNCFSRRIQKQFDHYLQTRQTMFQEKISQNFGPEKSFDSHGRSLKKKGGSL